MAHDLLDLTCESSGSRKKLGSGLYPMTPLLPGVPPRYDLFQAKIHPDIAYNGAQGGAQYQYTIITSSQLPVRHTRLITFTCLLP